MICTSLMHVILLKINVQIENREILWYADSPTPGSPSVQLKPVEVLMERDNSISYHLLKIELVKKSG